MVNPFLSTTRTNFKYKYLAFFPLFIILTGKKNNNNQKQSKKMTMTNPWTLLNKDVRWVLSHLHDMIFEFILRNTILSIHVTNGKPKPLRSELDFRYIKNIFSLLYLIIVTFLT